VALSIFCLAISIVIGSWILSNGQRNNEQLITSQSTLEKTNKLLTEPQLADYLGISDDEVKKLGPTPEGDGVTTSILPYIQIGNKIYFSKPAIDKWLKDKATTVVNQ
jgi:predicted DNA-binding transcriptional regulator AlpA